MSKYEIMTVLAPGTDLKVIEDVLKSVFDAKNIEKIEKLERTELAYEIKKHKQGIFVLANLKSEESLIEEFVRRVNILKKQVLRFLVINLDSERGMHKTFRPRKNDKHKFFSSKKNQQLQQKKVKVFKNHLSKNLLLKNQKKQILQNKMNKTKC
ncbi:30S ribosomal protein S6 [Mesomycoplasma hyorhinis]|uniref:Small ribosomal subunit protein bS6 n=1 Tax=Mesomycoplasma hyorhinis (strain MCLD) TaxID=936139 RepID=A0ABM5M6F9_MESHM|nr:30S ribosomal protein S6 [Mesomycoplasma hyorhinis MCLD]